MMVPGAERQLQLGDEERIDERLARRAHDLEERLAKLGAPGIQRPKDLLEFVNNLKHKSVGGQQLPQACFVVHDELLCGPTLVLAHDGLAVADVRIARQVLVLLRNVLGVYDGRLQARLHLVEALAHPRALPQPAESTVQHTRLNHYWYSTMQYRGTQSYYTAGAGCIMYNTYFIV